MALQRAAERHGHQLALRVRGRFEAYLAGGQRHEYASELNPRAHIFLSDELSLLDVDDQEDDGVVVVDTPMLTARDGFEILIPFAPWHVDRSRFDERHRWPLPGTREKIYGIDDQRRHILPADTYLCSAVTVHTSTENGRDCDSRAGNTFHLLSELFDPASFIATEGGDVRVEWQYNGDSPLAKGALAITEPVRLVSMGDHGGTVDLDWTKHIVFADVDEFTLFHGSERSKVLAGSGEQQERMLIEHANDALKIFIDKTAPLAVPDPKYMHQLHCPYYLTAAGMLDGSMYALNIPRRAPAWEFYARVLDIILTRNDVLAADLLLGVDAQRRETRRLLPVTRFIDGKIYGEMFTVMANSFPYENDFVNEGGQTKMMTPADKPGQRRRQLTIVFGAGKFKIVISEDYKIARLYHADDCEGVALEIDMEYAQFERIKVPDAPSQDVERTALLRLLRHFVELARQKVYVDTLPLAAVTNASMDHEKRELDEKNVMAHTFCALVPTALFIERLQDGAKTGEYAGMVANVMRSRHIAAYNQNRRLYDAQRDVLILEGTARSSAFQVPVGTLFAGTTDKDAAVDRAVERIRQQGLLMRGDRNLAQLVSLEVMQNRVDDAKGNYASDRQPLSDFYQTISSWYTRCFVEVGQLDFALARKKPDGSLTHGLHFNKFAAVAEQRSTEWVFVPYNRVDADEGIRASRIFSRLEPVPAIVVDPTAKIPSVDAFNQFVAKDAFVAKRHGEASAVLRRDPTRMPLPPRSLVITARHDELCDPAIAQRLKRALDALGRPSHMRSYYLADPPVRNDDLPPIIIHDIEVRLD